MQFDLVDGHFADAAHEADHQGQPKDRDAGNERQLTVFGLPARRPSNFIRLGCLVLAAGLFAYYAVAVAPALNGALRSYWEAAAAGNVEAAGRDRDLVAAYHSTAQMVFQLNLALVTGALAASAAALAPGARNKPGLPEPRLLTHPS